MSRDGGEALPPRRPRPKPIEEPAEFDDEAGESFHSAPKGFSKKPKSGFDPDNPRPILSQGPTLLERILFGSVSSAQLAAFSRQLSAYLDAGIDMFRAFSSLEKQFARTASGRSSSAWRNRSAPATISPRRFRASRKPLTRISSVKFESPRCAAAPLKP